MGHINIPIFIPHLGCPNQCIFCNQRHISGKIEFNESDVERQICEVLSTIGEKTAEIAFFGGSFTGIDRNLMIRLLDIAQKYVDMGNVIGIRMSTRPDYISKEILDILKNYKITCIELGIQTTNDDILRLLKRGHTFNDTKRAIALLKTEGFSFVGQMMIGLPGATLKDELECAEFICKSGAVASRLYPTLVFKQTELEQITNAGEYAPLELQEAVERTAQALEVFLNYNVPCIRIGLCESENLHSEQSFVAGPNHPAIGELVKSEIYLKLIISKLDDMPYIKSPIIHCPKGAASQIIGNRRKNIILLREKYQFKQIKVIEKSSLMPFSIEIKNKED